MKTTPRLCLLLLLLCGALADTQAQEILPRLVAENDELIARATPAAAGSIVVRGEAVRLLVYACGYVAPTSRHHRDPTLRPGMEAIVAKLAAAQHPSGLFDVGNLESPPDTGFILEAMVHTHRLLEGDADPDTIPLRGQLRAVIIAAAYGVADGGMHTPNHRWGIAAALAGALHVHPEPRYRARIDEWLSEGIDQDADGQYAERSPAYSAWVVNPALLTLASELDRPDLAEHVRRNLMLTTWLMEPDGELISIASRRQDQRPGIRVTIAEYYLAARWLAVRTSDAQAAALAAWIERDFLEVLVSGAFDPNWPLPHLLLDPTLAGPLPAAGALQTEFVKHLPGTAIARIRRGASTATIYGGSDHGSGLGVASGLAMNPTFFAFRKGAAQVALRLTPTFFSTGFFYSQGLEKTATGWRLYERRAVPYYQPLPSDRRRTDGDYPLTPDGRFVAKMDFPNRPRQERVLEMEVIAEEAQGGWHLRVGVTGQPGVPVTLELTFAGDGELTQVTPLTGLAAPQQPLWLRRWGGSGSGVETTGAFVLREGMGRFTTGSEVIEFGPGHFTQPPGRMEGEVYTWIGGSAPSNGQRVYLTGVTPFRHELQLR